MKSGGGGVVRDRQPRTKWCKDGLGLSSNALKSVGMRDGF